MNVLAAMTQLAVARPPADAHPATVSAWYAAKARLHEYLASAGGPESSRATALSASARARSVKLLADVDGL